MGRSCLGCTKNHKTVLSNGCRDGIYDIFKRILPVTKMIHSGTQVDEKEVSNIVWTLPTLKPFDPSIRLNHLLTQRAWQVPFSRIGFDVVFIHSNKPAPSDPSIETASFNKSVLRLREGEKKKFARRTGGRGTNDISAKTITADEVIGEINDANYSFIPIAVGPDHINASFNHLTYDPRGSDEGDYFIDEDELDGPSELDWKWFNVDFLDGHRNGQQHTTPAASASLSPSDLGRAGASGTAGT
eukprot:scaffold135285_cov38-Cyclotella_meneghiniana.AAC.1